MRLGFWSSARHRRDRNVLGSRIADNWLGAAAARPARRAARRRGGASARSRATPRSRRCWRRRQPLVAAPAGADDVARRLQLESRALIAPDGVAAVPVHAGATDGEFDCRHHAPPVHQSRQVRIPVRVVDRISSHSEFARGTPGGRRRGSASCCTPPAARRPWRRPSPVCCVERVEDRIGAAGLVEQALISAPHNTPRLLRGVGRSGTAQSVRPLARAGTLPLRDRPSPVG